MLIRNKQKFWFLALLLILIIASVIYYFTHRSPVTEIDNTPFRDAAGRLIVSTTLFPVYDFAKNVGGDKVSVFLILPAGQEAHAYRPSAPDLEKINQSALFFYTSDLMEPWAQAVVANLSSKTRSLATASGLNDDLDPHVWLDFSKAMIMVDNISASYQSLDPENAAYYEASASSYKQKLNDLDVKFATDLKSCRFNKFFSGGHNTFSYLAKHYNLEYEAAQDYIPDNTLDVPKILSLSKELKDAGQTHVFYEELISPYLAELIRQESGARKISLNAAHNVGRFAVESGVDFLSLMENNLQSLKIGLACQ